MFTGNIDDNVLFTNKWIEVREKNGYVYSHAPWSKGIGVAILAYRENAFRIREYLGRYEVTPCHMKEAKLCSITGGYDNSDKFSIEECVLNELMEEGGFIAPKEALIHLGTVFPSKGSDTLQVLFAVNLDSPGVKSCDPTGDGTTFERGAYCKWVTEDDLVDASDPLNHAMIMRLNKYLRN